MRCPTCDLEHGPEGCVAALGRLATLLAWEVRELRSAVEHVREEQRRGTAIRTRVRGPNQP